MSNNKQSLKYSLVFIMIILIIGIIYYIYKNNSCYNKAACNLYKYKTVLPSTILNRNKSIIDVLNALSKTNTHYKLFLKDFLISKGYTINDNLPLNVALNDYLDKLNDKLIKKTGNSFFGVVENPLSGRKYMKAIKFRKNLSEHFIKEFMIWINKNDLTLFNKFYKIFNTIKNTETNLQLYDSSQNLNVPSPYYHLWQNINLN